MKKSQYVESKLSILDDVQLDNEISQVSCFSEKLESLQQKLKERGSLDQAEMGTLVTESLALVQQHQALAAHYKELEHSIHAHRSSHYKERDNRSKELEPLSFYLDSSSLLPVPASLRPGSFSNARVPRQRSVTTERRSVHGISSGTEMESTDLNYSASFA